MGKNHTGLLISAAIGTTIVIGVLNGVNTSSNAVLATLVDVGKFIVMAAAIMLVVKDFN